MDNRQADEDVMQISGAGHWFLEGWIGDHAVDFLVDSGSAVTAVSRSFYKTLVEAGAPVGDLRPTARKLRGANGSQIDISGCSSCVEQTPWDPYYRTRWTLGMGCYLQKEVCLFNYIAGMQHYLDASSLWDIAQFHHIPRRYSTVLPAWWMAGLCHLVAY